MNPVRDLLARAVGLTGAVLATPFALTFAYPPAPSRKQVLRNPLWWPLVVGLGIPFVVGFPLIWLSEKIGREW